ncbi:carbohydrate-binding module family 50 protein [Parathielavia hyrcaniae]|uniref:Carbohydrate-binding module family 50 protein n=1 Tax=Parathielavia hyrcaniae TaxID=113614 RepID=A0AAN6SYP5_9PEZI|nr:carbohydrate-binding module family 50 protein [Parathielavia hyrcaniae]
MAAAACLFGAFLLATSGFRPVLAQIFVSSEGSYGGQLYAPPNLSPSCAATFSEAVLGGPARASVTHCAGTDVVTFGYDVYPATYAVDLILHTFKWACLTDTTTGARCFSLLVQHLIVQQTGAETGTSPSDLCSACNLRLRQAALDSPLGYTDSLAEDYSSLTSSCQVTFYPVTSPTRYALGTTTASVPTPTDGVPVPSYTCESQYTIQESDTCESISWAKQVSTFSLLYANKLPMYCSDFPAAGTEICIPQRVAEKHGLTVAKLIELNPDLKSQCSSLRALTGYAICLTPPGVVSTTATPQPTTASYFDDDQCLNLGAPSSCFTTAWETPESDIPWPTASSSTGSSNTSSATATAPTLPAWTDPASLPRASGTRENCARYDNFYDDEPPSRYGNPNACWWRANFWGIDGMESVPQLRRGG